MAAFIQPVLVPTCKQESMDYTTDCLQAYPQNNHTTMVWCQDQTL